MPENMTETPAVHTADMPAPDVAEKSTSPVVADPTPGMFATTEVVEPTPPALTPAQEVLGLQGEINALIVKVKNGGRENEHRNNAVAHLQEAFTALTRDLKLAEAK